MSRRPRVRPPPRIRLSLFYRFLVFLVSLVLSLLYCYLFFLFIAYIAYIAIYRFLSLFIAFYRFLSLFYRCFFIIVHTLFYLPNMSFVLE